MDSASAWPCGHDGHLEPAICLDAVRQTVPGRDRRRAAHRSDHLLGADRPADAVLARPRMARRSVRAEGADRFGRSADRAWVGALGFRRQHLDVVPDLRGPVRGRHRHRLCRRRRLDGEMVSGPARVRDRDRGGRLRNGRHAHDISDLLHARVIRRAEDPDRVRPHSRRRRRARRARPTRAPAGRSPRSSCVACARGRRRARPYAENADLLADVRDDDHDVDRRASW